MSAPVCHMIVWASGMIEFITDPKADPEPDGSILVCTAQGRGDIDALLEAVREASVLTDFGGRVALRVPNVDPDAPVAVLTNFGGRVALRVPNIDPASPVAGVHELIYWADDLRDELAADHSAIAWVRQ